MQPELIVTAVVSILCSGALLGFLQFLIQRHDNRKGAMSKVATAVCLQTLDISKLQIMLLIADYPKKVNEILEVTKHYFVDLNGDTYITALFEDWLKEQGIETPDWFKNHKTKEVKK